MICPNVRMGAPSGMAARANLWPRGTRAEEGLSRADPDAFLHGIWQAQPGLVAEAGEEVLARARQISGEDWQMRALLKKAHLPRIAKALSA